MNFGILGPLEVGAAERPVRITGGKQRALLAILLLHANEPVSSDSLIGDLWGERPPGTARKGLQMQVSLLRKALGEDEGRVVTQPNGYLARVEPGELDLERFERLADEGRRALAADDPERAAAALREALALWRGPALADLSFESFAQPAIGRLEELRLATLEDRIDADLARGRHAELPGELEALVVEHPLRERLRRQLVLALYRAGRQVEALAAYRAARAKLIDELGLEPTPELRSLEQAILTHDHALQAPASTGPPSGRLPAPPTRTLGRDQDREAVAKLLRRADVRLVTLAGPGGVGKTRLALEVARRLEPELPDGGWLVSLAATAQPEHVPSAIAQSLGVKPLEGETPQRAVERFLARKRGLLVLDNFEHLLPAAQLISDMLAAAPELAVLATSREALRLQAEQRYAVAPLELPVDTDLAAVKKAAAPALFVERARSHDPSFELTDDNAAAVAEICSRLDGLPLAIELAAARTTLLEPEELSTRLARALEVLRGGPRDAPDRQRTLRATIDWSHRFLSPPEAEAFARFAVFAGGATIEAAQEVTGADLDTLEGLVDKQLLSRLHGSSADARLVMLETVREYAGERLAADPDGATAQERHCRHYVALAERAEPELLTRGEALWLPRLDAELDNLRAALDWSLRHGDPTHALRLAALLAKFWDIRRLTPEGLDWTEAALEAAGDAASVRDRARARRAQVHLLVDQWVAYDMRGSLEEERSVAVEALALSREAAEPAGIADALLALASLDIAESHPQDRRRALTDEALAYASEAGDDRLVALALMQRAITNPLEGDTGGVEQAANALRKLGSERTLVSLYNDTAYSAIKAGSAEHARPLLARAIPLADELGDPLYSSLVCGNIGLEALFTGDLDRARNAFDESLRLCREHVLTPFAAEGLAGLAAIATRRGDPERAARLLGAATPMGAVGDADVTAQFEEQFFASARETPPWAHAYAEGAQMSFEQAIDFALSP